MAERDPQPEGQNGLLEGRDSRGRFVPGYRGGPGNAQARVLHLHRRAVAEAVTPEDLAKVMCAMRDKAIGGDTHAARVLLERMLGKPKEQSAEFAIDLDLTTPDGIADAFRRIAAAAASGTVPIDEARQVAGIVELAANATVLADLAQQLEQLKQEQ